MKTEDKLLIEDYFTNKLSPEGLDKLTSILDNSEEARSYFRTFAAVSEHLHEFPFTAKQSGSGSQPVKIDNAKSINTWLFVAACILLIFLVLNSTRHLLPFQSDSTKSDTARDFQADYTSLIDYYNPRFKGKSAPIEQLDFNRGVHRLESGDVHLRIMDSVDLLFTGPSTFEILGPKSIKVFSGQLRTVILNEKGKEFSIITPNSKYIDWGTEFCLNIAPGGLEIINVMEGEVELQDLNHNGASERLNRFSKEFSLPTHKKVKINKSYKNITPGKMGKLRHSKFLKDLSTNDDVIGIFDFNHTVLPKPVLLSHIPSPWMAVSEDLKLNRFITNLHTNNDELSHGVYHGANRSSGRWPNTHALDLYRKDSHLSIDLHEDHKELSVAFWLHPNGNFLHPTNALIRPYKWKSFGNLSIEISRSGKIDQFFWGEANLQKTKTNDSRLSPGWNHIVYTFGKEKDQVLSKLYLNGEVVNVAKPKWTQSLSMQNTIIGCFHTKAHGYFGGINGKLDELIIWKKTLDGHAIKKMFRSGLPMFNMEQVSFCLNY